MLIRFFMRNYWKDYYSYINGIVFVVDSADPESFSEAKAQLDDLLSVEEISKLPFLILGNKIDAPGAVSRDELKRCLGLHHITEVGLYAILVGLGS